MGNLAIKNNTQVNGVTVPQINGGFGENKKAMLALHVAEIHVKQLKHINELINENRERFRDNIDVIDVKNHNEFVVALTDYNIFTRMQVAKAKNIYLLSERGYAKLIKLFNDDKSWELYDVMLDEYFELRDANIVPINNTPMTPAEMLVVYAQQFLEQEKRLEEVDNKVTHIETELHKETLIEGQVNSNNIARKLTIFSKANKPHGQFIDAIAQELKIYSNTVGYEDEYMKVIRESGRGGKVTAVAYYSIKGVKLIEEYVKSNFVPKSKFYVRGQKKGEFNESSFTLGDKTYKFNKETSKHHKKSMGDGF